MLVLVPLGRELGALLASLPPLVAYGVDIAGSLAGIAAFATLSLLPLPPPAWSGVLFHHGLAADKKAGRWGSVSFLHSPPQ